MTQPNVTIRCNLCLYWQQDQRAKTGLCRRYAPRPVTEFFEMEAEAKTQASTAAVCWPITTEWDWCGEFELAEESD